MTLFLVVAKKYFMAKVAFVQKNQLGIGLPGRKWPEMGQKLDFRALFSEIKTCIGLFLSLEHYFTCAPIAQLVAHSTFFL